MENCKAETKVGGGVEICGSDHLVRQVAVKMMFGTVRTWLCRYHREQFHDFGCEVVEVKAAQADPAPPTSV